MASLGAGHRVGPQQGLVNTTGAFRPVGMSGNNSMNEPGKPSVQMQAGMQVPDIATLSLNSNQASAPGSQHPSPQNSSPNGTIPSGFTPQQMPTGPLQPQAQNMQYVGSVTSNSIASSNRPASAAGIAQRAKRVYASVPASPAISHPAPASGFGMGFPQPQQGSAPVFQQSQQMGIQSPQIRPPSFEKFGPGSQFSQQPQQQIVQGPYAMNQQPAFQPGNSGPPVPMQGNASQGQFHQTQQPRPKIDPNQVPSPIVVHESDQEAYEDQIYSTVSRSVPPLAATRFKAVDEGNCNPRFMRFTTFNVPTTDEISNMSMLPFGAIIQPLADLSPDEMPVPVVDYGESGPLRCRRCRAYINPWFAFSDGGRKMVCNLCGCDTEVPPEHFCNLDMSGRRMDLASRPELLYGAVEFRASKEYSVRPAIPPVYVFAIDVSWNSVQFGMLRHAVEAIRGLLYEGETGGLPRGSKVAIYTFDRAVQFYCLKANLEQPHMLVVPDVEDMFVPLSEGFLVDPWESRVVIENLLNSLPGLFDGNKTSEAILGAAAQAAHIAMKEFGGKLVLFQTCLPLHGPGALKNREDVKLLNTDSEKKLYEPAEYFWRKMGEDYSKLGICVDMYLFPATYMDIASIGALSSITGGDLFVYTNFDAGRDGLRFEEDFKKVGRRNFGFEGLMRVRCSDGIGVSHHFGNFCIRSTSPTDVEFGGIDSQKSIGVAFKHERKLDETASSYFQVALLYTNFAGDRRIRVLNFALSNTATISTLFRSADVDCTVNYLAKASVSQAFATSLKHVREQLTERCVKILLAYRKHSALNTSTGQLILPEALKLFPLYTLSMLKSKPFRSPIMSSDGRITALRALRNIGVSESVAYFYPRIFAIHQLENFGAMDNRNNIKMPTTIRASYSRLDPEGIYLLENGMVMYCWVGRNAPPDLVTSVFGVPRVEEIDVKMRTLPVLQNKLNSNSRLLVSLCQLERPRYMQLQVVRQHIDGPLENEFHGFLTEDQNNDAMNYVDYLCFVHRNIQMELSG
ncbi:COPII coat Sec23p-Sfb3p heterodimer component [Entophlyctis luteolus]|nr:COPII coat Sec23p-Sfb3p heterodimer component [Entophlyctis luteolus]